MNRDLTMRIASDTSTYVSVRSVLSLAIPSL